MSLSLWRLSHMWTAEALRELKWSGIDYEVLGTEPLRLSGIEATVHSENSN